MPNYCVGSCFEFDELTGNLTIQQAPLGGLECTPDGQSIRIAGNTTGVAVNARNNGLFKTTSGELGALVAPHMRVTGVAAAQTEINSVLNTGTFNYASVATQTITNPSTTYRMTVVVHMDFRSDFETRALTGASKVYVNPQLNINGAGFSSWTSPITISHGVSDAGSASGTPPRITYRFTTPATRAFTVDVGGSLTIAARQQWDVSSASSAQRPYGFWAFTGMRWYGYSIRES